MSIGVCIYIFRCQISVIQDFKNQNFNSIAIFAINRKLIIEMTWTFNGLFLSLHMLSKFMQPSFVHQYRLSIY